MVRVELLSDFLQETELLEGLADLLLQGLLGGLDDLHLFVQLILHSVLYHIDVSPTLPQGQALDGHIQR